MLFQDKHCLFRQPKHKCTLCGDNSELFTVESDGAYVL